MNAVLSVADRLHSAAIHLLRRVRKQDIATGEGPARLSALSVLVFGGAKTLKELAAAEQVKPPTMSRIVSGLERAGLVKREATEDGRRVRLRATPKGTKILWEGRKRRVESLANALGLLGETDRGRLAELAELLREIVRKI